MGNQNTPKRIRQKLIYLMKTKEHEAHIEYMKGNAVKAAILSEQNLIFKYAVADLTYILGIN